MCRIHQILRRSLAFNLLLPILLALGANALVTDTANAAPIAPVVTSSTAVLPGNATTLTINGANFDPVAANNTVVLSNGAVGTVTAATATSLTVTISTPPTSSGALTAIVTTNGVSSGAAVQVATVPPPPPGSVASEGGVVMQATRLRQLLPGSDGTGIRIGVVSDSYNRLGGAAADVASGDLPGNVTVLTEGAVGGTDEGRAMLQVIHDLAPGATLGFAAAGVSQASAAQAIRDLANTFQADVIVGSMIFFKEPFFQDGVIAQAIDDVVQNSGVAYFSAAGNLGNQAFELTSAPSVGSESVGAANFGVPTFILPTALDLDPGSGTDRRQSITLNNNQTATLVLQWSDPFFASVGTDLDVYLVDQATNQLVAISAADSIGSDEPVEVVSYTNTSGAARTYEIIIDHFSGPTPNRIKWVNYGGATGAPLSSVEYATNSSTILPHAASANAMAVAPVPYFDQRTAESFSSRGPATILFSPAGAPISPTVRAKPDLAGVNGVNTTFFGGDTEGDGRPNFFGSSAAAAHVAAVAALVLQANPTFQPAQLYARLKASAVDLGAAGADSITGSGLVNAFTAVQGPATPASVPLTENFDAGLNARWEVNSRNNGRVLFQSLNNDGNRRMLMDTFFGFNNSLNEAVLHFDATSAGTNEIELAFVQREFGDEDNPMPATFTGSSNSDGVALSVDGVNWYRLVSLTGGNSTSTFRDFKFNLTQFATSNGLVLGPDVRLKFQQFDNSPISSDGFAFDDVAVRTVPAAPRVTVETMDGNFTDGQPANFSFTATGNPAFTVQWQVSTDGGVTFGDISGATSSTLTFNATLADTGKKYRAVLTNSEGTVNTAIATLTVTEAPSLRVTTTSDAVNNADGQTSLREAIAYATVLGGNPTITFEGPVFTDATADTITLGGTQIQISDAMTVEGPGADLLSISGGGTSRIFLVDGNPGVVTLRGLSLVNGRAVGTADDGAGGAISFRFGNKLVIEGCRIADNTSDSWAGAINKYDGVLEIRDCTFSGNVANSPGTGCGAIFNQFGKLVIVNSTFSGNSAPNATPGNGGGGAIHSRDSLVLSHSTVTGNRVGAGADGGGIDVWGNETITHSIIAGNFVGTGTTPSDIVTFGTPIESATHNLIGDAGTSGGITDGTNGNLVGNAGTGTRDTATVLDPVLADNGGLTPTHKLVVGSPAIDAGSTSFDANAFTPALSNDQRGAGFARVRKGLASSPSARIDIGAYELIEAPVFTTADLEVNTGGAAFDLATASGVTPAGGTFSGTGVNSGNGTFDPTGLALGAYRVTYTVGDANGTNSTDLTVTVIEIPSLTVTTTGDTVSKVDGQTSLREAFGHAATLTGPQTITFSSSTANDAENFHDGTPRTIELLGRLQVRGAVDITIAGPGADVLEISGRGVSRVFSFGDRNAVFALRDLTLADGFGIVSDNARGSVITNDSTLTLERCVIRDSETLGVESSGGGGLYTTNTTTIIDSTFTGNLSRTMTDAGMAFGGGIYATASARVKVINSTISGNAARSVAGQARGGGIYAEGNGEALELIQSTVTDNEVSVTSGTDTLGGGVFGNITAGNSLIAGNTSTGDAADVSGNVVSRGHNLILNLDATATFSGDTTGNLTTLDPQLAPLGAYGGPTPTHALLPGSPAIDAGLNALAIDETAAALATDQRGAGFDRIVKGLATSTATTVDIGAFELFAAPSFTTGMITILVDGEPFDLAAASGASPAGGVFRGTGVAGGLFYPDFLDPGIYPVTYTIEDAFGVRNVAVLLVKVEELPPALVVSKPRPFRDTVINKRSREQRITIRNRGGTVVKGLRLVTSGSGRRDFRAGQPVLKTLEGGKATFFRVSFRPKKEGVRTARITVLNDRTPVTVTVQGRGLPKPVIRPPRAITP